MPPGLPGSRPRRPAGRRFPRRRDAGAPPTRSTPGDDILVVVGLALEARGLLRGLPPAARRGLTVRTVGPKAVGLSRVDLARSPGTPGALLVTGLAGGCAPDLRPADVVVGDPVTTFAGGPGRVGDPTLRRRAVRALERAGLRYRVGPLLTLDEVATDPAAKAECWRTRGALAVDMESAHVLDWARRTGIPALTVRAIADGPEEDVPRALFEVVGADGGMRPWVAARLLARPSLIGPAWRLGRRSRLALGSLAQFLRAFVDTPGEP